MTFILRPIPRRHCTPDIVFVKPADVIGNRIEGTHLLTLTVGKGAPHYFLAEVDGLPRDATEAEIAGYEVTIPADTPAYTPSTPAREDP